MQQGHHGYDIARGQPSSVELLQAVQAINARRYRRQGDEFLARYTATIVPIMPDVDYIGRRGVDLVALARAIERGLNIELFGRVIEYKAWSVEEFNLFIRSSVSIETINTSMKIFLDHPRNW